MTKTIVIDRKGKYPKISGPGQRISSQLLEVGTEIKYPDWIADNLIGQGDAHLAETKDAPKSAPETDPVDPPPDPTVPPSNPEGTAEPDAPVNATEKAVELATTMGLDLAEITGSGPGGRILKADVEKAVSATGD